ALDIAGLRADPNAVSVVIGPAAAEIVEATAFRIVIAVPSDATTGTLVVNADGVESTLDRPFIVATPAASPVITNVNLTMVGPGDLVTVHGSGFGSAPRLRVNRTEARITSSTDNEIIFLVPRVTGPGAVQIATEAGAVVGPDLFIAPIGVRSVDLGFVGRASIGAPARLDVAEARPSLLAFDGTRGSRI